MTKTPTPLSVIPMPANGKPPDPGAAPYFLVAKDGIYIRKNMFFGPVTVPIKEIPTLPDVPDKQQITLNFPKFPATMLGQAWSFFRWAWDTHKAEAMLDITWHNDHGYRFFVPRQVAIGAGVRCLRNETHFSDGWQHIGTIHSHCNGSAGHSGTDTHDAESHDGIHMTMGRVSANKPDLAVMFAANKFLWHAKDPWEHLDTADVPFVEHPKWWERYWGDETAKEFYKNASFSAGARPKGASVPQSQLRFNRFDDEDAWGMSYGGNWWGGRNNTPSTGKPKSPWSDHNVNELADLVGAAHDQSAFSENLATLQGVTKEQWQYDADIAAAMLEDLITDIEEQFGLYVQVKLQLDTNLTRQRISALQADKPYPKPKGPKKPKPKQEN